MRGAKEMQMMMMMLMLDNLQLGSTASQIQDSITYTLQYYYLCKDQDTQLTFLTDIHNTSNNKQNAT